jgi:hypothetical protein
MSIGPTFAPAVAGGALAQAHAAQAERGREAAERQIQATFAASAEQAAGVGATDGEEHQTSDRDADGRRLWEAPAIGRSPKKAGDSTAEANSPPVANDPTGALGHGLDLSG